MASLNKCLFMGNLTKDPEVRFMPNGDAVANFTLACNSTLKDKDGAKHDKAEFINIVTYRKLAEIVGEYLKKGSQIYLEGKLQTRKWEKDGITRYSTEIIMDEMKMLGGKPESGTQRDSEQTSSNSSANDASNFDDVGDDIPWD